MRSPITTHVLDTSLGRPAAGVEVELYVLDGDHQRSLGKGRTDADGRIGAGLISDNEFRVGVYRVRFFVGAYYSGQGISSLYPDIAITFQVSEGQSHYHIPLLLSPFGYTTYRGS